MEYATFKNEVELEINSLTARNCVGCRVDHPSQRRHDCLMMDLIERVLTYGEEAIAIVCGRRMGEVTEANIRRIYTELMGEGVTDAKIQRLLQQETSDLQD
ncbi:hypothetical protein BaRGS_00008839, partial [Batillaria attramentaria]